MPPAPISRPTSSWATSRECWATAASRTSVVPRDGACRTPTPSPRSRLPSAARRSRARPSPPRACYAFLTPTALAPRLVEAGFTHLNLANNHANDFGSDGPRHRPSGSSIRLACAPTARWAASRWIPAPGRQLRPSSGLVGFTTYPHSYDLLDIARSAAVVDSVRALVDLLVVTFHGGAEGATALHVPEAAESLGSEPRGDLRAWARAVIDAGADAVVGHGPHVLRGIEYYRGQADRVFAGELPHLSRLQPGGPARAHRRAAPRGGAGSPLAARAFRRRCRRCRARARRPTRPARSWSWYGRCRGRTSGTRGAGARGWGDSAAGMRSTVIPSAQGSCTHRGPSLRSG